MVEWWHDALEWFWDYADTVMPIPFIVAFLGMKKKGRQERIIFVLCCISVVIFGYSNYLANRGTNNMILYHLFSLIELFMVLLYAITLFEREKMKRILVAGFLAYLIYWIVNIIVWEPLVQFNSHSSSISYLLILIVCGLYFLSLNDRPELLHFQKLPSFWVMTGFLFYTACGIPIVLAYKYREIFYDIDANDAWKIQVLSNSVKFVLIFYAAICSYRYQDGS